MGFHGAVGLEAGRDALPEDNTANSAHRASQLLLAMGL